MRVGFIILNYNTANMTMKLAKCIEAYKSISDIVIVDNCSTDDSYMKLKEIENEKIKVYKTDHNGGYSFGNNYAMNRCKELGDEFAFIANPDVEVEEKSVEEIIEVLLKREFSLVTCLQYEIDGSLGMPPILTLNTFRDDLFDCFFIMRKIRRYQEKNSVLEQRIIEIEMFRGSFFAVSVESFFSVKGFDEGVFLYCEERILSRKFIEKGMKMAMLTDCKYDHMHSVSIDNAYKNRSKKIGLLYKARLYYNIKYNNISVVKRHLLKVAMSFSMLEYFIADYIKKLKK